MKRISVLGSTGSIGRTALALVANHRDKFKVVGLTAGRNILLLEKQIRSFIPEVVAVADHAVSRELKKRLGRTFASLKILSGQDGIAETAAYGGSSDFVLSAIVGAAGLMPTLAAIRAGKTIGLANKESLVMAGNIVSRESKKYRAKILPVDSEHSAIFQCLEGHKKSAVRNIILTASGGPFNGKKRNMDTVSPADALRHPKWKMGKKISIDSATLMNKGLEVIEARHLFKLPQKKIKVLIHPQSIVHSMVEFHDGSLLAQLSVPDMKGPIAYALTYPNRLTEVLDDLSLSDIGTLTFQKPDTKRFPCLSSAYLALEAGGTMPSVLNAANEIAVNAFLKGELRFSDIPVVIRKTMDHHTVMPDRELDVVIEADR